MMPRTRLQTLLRLFPAIFLIAATAARAETYIDFGTGDSIAISQPFVQFEMVDPDDGEVDGPDVLLANYLALVDTAAQGVLLAQPAYLDPAGGLLGTPNPDKYDRAVRPGSGEPISYTEQGVAGFTTLDLLEPYNLRLYQTDGQTVDSDQPLRAIGDPGLDQLGFFGGIVGTAFLEGRATVFDHTKLSGGSFVLNGVPVAFPHIGVEFHDVAPAADGHRYDLDLEPIVIPPTGSEQPGDPLPSFGNLYAVPGVGLHAAGLSAAGDMVVDTGAQLSIISTHIADALGLDYQNATDTIQVGGLGGDAVDAPIVGLDHITLPTEQGVDLKLRDLEVIVLDIEGLDIGGILGANVLTSGYFGAVLENLLGAFDGDVNDWRFDEEIDFSGPDLTVVDDGGFFHRAIFDLADPADPKLRLDVNPALDHPVPEPATLALLIAAAGFALTRRRRSLD
jgi:hypothetical protein